MVYGGHAKYYKPKGFNGKKRRKAFVSASTARRTAYIANVPRVISTPMNVRTGGYEGREMKFVDYNKAADAFTVQWTGGEMEDSTALSLSAVAQGDGESQRDGRVYHIHSVHIRGFIDVPVVEGATAPVGDILARLAMVWDTQTNGAQLNAEDVYLGVGAGEDVNSFRNLQNSKRFIVLKEKMLRLPRANAQMNEGSINLFANGDLKIHFTFNKKFNTPIKVRCSGTTAAIASVTDNSIHLIGTATATALKLTYESRVRFTG